MQSEFEYRPDLDGLRAIAILPVILFHLGFPYTPGGFVGVDVFFVLSGYLITRQIALELRENRFSLLDFYDRRVRRLFPALFVMLIGSTILALLVLLPRDLDSFGESLVAAVLSISNFYFWTESGYFAPSAETMPLLHTWSLAVEEQFYLLFPALMLLIWRFGRANVWLTLTLLALVSFGASIWAAQAKPSAGFYLLPMRAWELLLGSLLALAPSFGPGSSQQRRVAASVGLVGIAAAVLTFDASTPFPGLAAALPSLGAALVIWAGQPSASGVDAHAEARPLVLRLLALPPLVFIGLISYSLYLWHWPLIVFAGQWSYAPLSFPQTALVVCATFIVAAASWRFIEQPLRRGTSLWTTRGLRVRYSGVFVAILALTGVTLDLGGGFPWLQPRAVLAIVNDARDRSPLRERCHFEPHEQGRREFAETCVFGDAAGRKIVVLGDSHGAELSYALSEVARERHLQVRQITASGCAPLLGFASSSKRPGCARHNNKMIGALGESPPSTILIAAVYFNRHAAVSAQRDRFWGALERTVSTLRQFGHNVVLLGGWPPHPGGDLPHALAKEVRRGNPVADYAFAIDPARAEIIDENLKAIAERQGATYIPLLQAVCGDTLRCHGVSHGQSIYFDGGHLTATSARHIVRNVILPALKLDATADDPRTTGQ